MIKVIVSSHANGAAEELDPERLSELVGEKSATLWVDVADPTPEEITRLGQEFGFHPLALEDTIRGGQRPKLDSYDDYQFIVFYGLTSEDGRIATHEVDIFVAKHFLVSVHRSGLPAIEETAARWHANLDALGNRGVGFLLYCLLDSLVDGYFPVMDDVSERADSLEETIILRGQPGLQAEILQLRRDLLKIRRVAGPERDVLNVLIRRDPPLFSSREIVYFQDVYDHLLRITDSVDVYRDMLASVLDANLSMVSYNLNVLVKRLTSFSIILMSMSLVAGIYGMNFVFMPELDWRLGYPFALALMVAIAAAEVALFRRIGWL